MNGQAEQKQTPRHRGQTGGGQQGASGAGREARGQTSTDWQPRRVRRSTGKGVRDAARPACGAGGDEISCSSLRSVSPRFLPGGACALLTVFLSRAGLSAKEPQPHAEEGPVPRPLQGEGGEGRREGG